MFSDLQAIGDTLLPDFSGSQAGGAFADLVSLVGDSNQVIAKTLGTFLTGALRKNGSFDLQRTVRRSAASAINSLGGNGLGTIAARRIFDAPNSGRSSGINVLRLSNGQAMADMAAAMGRVGKRYL